MENEILDVGCYRFISFTCQDNKNELSIEKFEKYWNVTIKEKNSKNILS